MAAGLAAVQPARQVASEAIPTASTLRQTLVGRPDAIVRRDRTLTRVAVGAGVILLLGGLAKFVFHGWELDAFRRFELPVPEVTVVIIGILETAGGVLLCLRRLVVPTAVVQACIMTVAIAVSGIGHGDVVPSLTLAPLLLAGLLSLIARTRAASPAGRPASRG